VAVVVLLKSSTAEFERFARASENVRRAVVSAVGYRGWSEARELLERVAREDAGPGLREMRRPLSTLGGICRSNVSTAGCRNAMCLLGWIIPTIS
jgi:hypothetical protein